MKLLDAEAVDEIHAEVLAASGGLPGKSPDRPVEAVLFRVYNHVFYGNVTDVAQAAALYAYSIAVGHPYVDGNKRTAMAAMILFLELNGHQCTAADFDLVDRMVAIADHRLGLEEFTRWLRKHV